MFDPYASFARARIATLSHLCRTDSLTMSHCHFPEANFMTTRRSFFAGCSAIAIAALIGPARAHHGWRWTAKGEFELSGVITAARLGMPHGILTVDAEGEIWTVEVGQPWRNEAAGVTDSMLAVGVEIVALGHRSANETERRMKAEKLKIGETLHDLYPNRS